MSRLFLPIAGIITFLLHACSGKPSPEDLKKFAATETFPEDRYLDTALVKKALVIVAHDDDDCAMAGTIAKLKSKGWQVKQLSFVAHPRDDGNGHPASIIAEGNEPIIEDGLYRLGLDTMKYPYLPVPLDEMKKQFPGDKITKALQEKIARYQPGVLFTLDNEMGGYGHPEHIYISALIYDLFKAKAIPVQRIYQAVYTDHMEKEIVDTWLYNKMKNSGYPNPTQMAKQLYGLTGMPAPTVQVSIREFGKAKMDYLMAYPESVKKNLRKFMPYVDRFDGETYFGIFNREFFRVIE